MAIFSAPAPQALSASGLAQAFNCPGGAGSLAAFKLLTLTDYAHVVVSHEAIINNEATVTSASSRAGLGVLDGGTIQGVVVDALGDIYTVSATVDVDGLTPIYTLVATSPNRLHHLIALDTSLGDYPFTVDHTIPVLALGLGSGITPCILLASHPAEAQAPSPNIQEIVVGSTLFDSMVTLSDTEVVGRIGTTHRLQSAARVYNNLWGKQEDRSVALPDTNTDPVANHALYPVNATKVLYRDQLVTHQIFETPVYVWNGWPLDQQDYLQVSSQGVTGYEWDHAAMVAQGSGLYHDSGSTFYVSEDGFLFYTSDDTLSSGDPRVARQWQFTDLKPYLAFPNAVPNWNTRNGFFSPLGDDSDLTVQWNNGIFSLSGVDVSLVKDGTVLAQSSGFSLGGGVAGGWYLQFEDSGVGNIAHVINDALPRDRIISTSDPLGRVGSFTNIVYNSGYFITGRLRWQFPGGADHPSDMYEEIWVWDFTTPDATYITPTYVVDLPYYPMWLESYGEQVILCGGLGGWTEPSSSRVLLNHIDSNNATTTPYRNSNGYYIHHPNRDMGVISFYDPGGDVAHYSFPDQSIIRFNRVKPLSGAVEGLPAGWYGSSVSSGTQTNLDPIESSVYGEMGGEISAIDFDGLTLTPLVRLDPGQLDLFALGLDPNQAYPQYHYYLPLDFVEADTVLAIAACYGNGVFVFPPIVGEALYSDGLEVVLMNFEFN